MTSAASYLSEDVDCAHTLAVFWALRAAALQSQVSVGKVVSSTDYVLTPGWNIHTAGCYPQQTFPLSAAVGLHLRAMSLSNTLIIHAWLSDARQPPRTLRIRCVNTPRPLEGSIGDFVSTAFTTSVNGDVITARVLAVLLHPLLSPDSPSHSLTHASQAVQLHILGFLSPSDLLRVSIVCKALGSLVRTSALVWNRLCAAAYPSLPHSHTSGLSSSGVASGMLCFLSHCRRQRVSARCAPAGFPIPFQPFPPLYTDDDSDWLLFPPVPTQPRYYPPPFRPFTLQDV